MCVYVRCRPHRTICRDPSDEYLWQAFSSQTRTRSRASHQGGIQFKASSFWFGRGGTLRELPFAHLIFSRSSRRLSGREKGGHQSRKRVVGASGLDPSLLFFARHKLSRIMGKRGRYRYCREGGGSSRSVWDFTQRRLNIEVFRWLACTRLWWRLAGGEKVFVDTNYAITGEEIDRPTAVAADLRIIVWL